nr:ATP synthase F0 subunit 8 [Duva florida]
MPHLNISTYLVQFSCTLVVLVLIYATICIYHAHQLNLILNPRVRSITDPKNTGHTNGPTPPCTVTLISLLSA